MQPLTVQVYRERIVAWQYLAVYDVFTVTPSTDHNLQRVKTCLWLRLMLLILVKPRLHPVFYAFVRGQSSSHLDTSLEIAFRQIIITHCNNFCTLPY
ncbi:hypothetical protein Y032_0058g2901 [Ancylostoma ceylanicum]|uniref:Uncharacterized protein n=1 Tax=Ancylostoma ceylanicum TaxID=53326 RepID=A0A016U528_9BILA|nr:hypothetical protein Y032_0058g2901 [Ancylostoma ceylanicum]